MRRRQTAPTSARTKAPSMRRRSRTRALSGRRGSETGHRAKGTKAQARRRRVSGGGCRLGKARGCARRSLLQNPDELIAVAVEKKRPSPPRRRRSHNAFCSPPLPWEGLAMPRWENPGRGRYHPPGPARKQTEERARWAAGKRATDDGGAFHPPLTLSPRGTISTRGVSSLRAATASM